jgi:hypothetical protein
MPIDTPDGNEISPEVRSLVERVAAGQKVTADGTWFVPEGAGADSYTVKELLWMRQAIRDAAYAYDHRDINRHTLLRLLDSVDEDMKKIVESSGDEKAIRNYQKLRYEHEATMLSLQDPAVLAIREGRYDDLELAIEDRQTGPQSIKALRRLLGDTLLKDVHTLLLGRLLVKHVSEEAVFDLEGLRSRLSHIEPADRVAVYGPRIEQILKGERPD